MKKMLLRRSLFLILPGNRKPQLNPWSETVAYHKILRHFSCKEEFIVKSPHPDVTIPRIPFHRYLWRDIDQWPDKVALECSVSKKQYTYSEALKLSKAFTSIFQNNFQLRKGDCVAIISPNIPEYPLFLTGTSEGGLVLTTVNFIYTPDEIAKQLRDSKAKVAITTPSIFRAVKEAFGKSGQDLPILVIKDVENEEIPKGGICLETLVKSAQPSINPVDIQPDDVLAMPYSSGTTGLPKGVQLTHGSVVSNLAQFDSPHVRWLLKTSASQQDTVLGLLPMYHIYGLIMGAIGTLVSGGKVVTFPKFEPKQFLEGIVQHKIEALLLVPPLVLFLADHPSVEREHLKYARLIMTGAAPVGKADMERLQKKAPHVLQIQAYGMTELSPLALMAHKDRIDKSSCGVPIPNTLIKVVDMETGESLPSECHGELFIKGPQVMRGYFNREDASEDVLVNGWLRTGDIGYYDEDGDFYIIDRAKELIKVKGLQVAPAELEALLREQPDIVDAAVVGISDVRSGEVPRAFVVKAHGSKLTEEEVADFVTKKVSKHKWLTGGVQFVETLPKSASGKLLRRELKKL